MISNLYGEHEVDGTTVSKGTVINFFVNRALAGETLTVYQPGTQARNYIHVKDVARAFVSSTERLIAHRSAGDSPTEWYELATDEDYSVMTVAEIVQDVARGADGIDLDVEIVPNPRGNETLIDHFEVDTSAGEERLGWQPQESIERTIRSLVTANSM